MNPLDELKQHRNWIVHTPDKTPWQISGLEKASPINPAHWCDYASALAVVTANPGVLGLGFVLTREAGFAVVDLDTYKTQDPTTLAEHRAIYDGLASYSEYSPSGKGVHIWLRGYVPSKRLDEKAFEVFANEKYCTVTFNPLRNVPIVNLQNELTAFHKFYWPESQNGHHPPTIPEGESFEVTTPQEILTRCAESMNGDKWKRLWEGRPGLFNTKKNEYPSAEYKSHSEADQALCNILAFHCNNRELVGKLWQQSPLAQTQEKRNRPSWVKGTVDKAFDRKLPISNELTGLLNRKWEESPRTIKLESVGIEPPPPDDTIPELPELPQKWLNPTGLIMDIASYIYNSSVLPTPEVSMVAAVTLMAAICGKAYNTVTGSGLNLYIALLANSGLGKEAAARGISALVKYVTPLCVNFSSFVGPSDIASPQALLKYLGDGKEGSDSFYAHIGEIGMWMQKLNSKYAQTNETRLKGMLLDVYHKSGHKEQLQGSIYSDKAKNAPIVYSPAFSILGDSTPDEFWKAIDERSLRDGLISRFNIIECRNIRPKYQENANEFQPDQLMIWNLAFLANSCLQWNKTRLVKVVLETDEARDYQLAYQKECQDRVWKDNTNPLSAVWSRSHIKMLRLGALSAIGNNQNDPVATLADYVWARDFIEIGNRAVLKRHESGDMGSDSEGHQQRREVAKQLVRFCKEPYQLGWLNSYSVDRAMYTAHIVSYRFLYARLCKYACFKNSKNYRMELNNTLEMLCESGTLTKKEATTDSNNGVKAICYVVNDVVALEHDLPVEWVY